LAQYAMTGCFNGTYYTSDKDQLTKTLQLANKVDPKFVAKLAVYARQKGLMKDMPAVLAAVVAGGCSTGRRASSRAAHRRAARTGLGR